MTNPFIGQITIFAGNFAPRAFAFCEGQLLAISSHTALFSILGTTYGGDGRTTFALPDLRGRVSVSPGTGPGLSTYKLGQRGGVEDVTLNLLQLPAHSHLTSVSGESMDIVMSTDAGVRDTPQANDVMAGSGFGSGLSVTKVNTYGPDSGTLVGSQLLTAPTQTLGNTGGNQEHENRRPFLAINYIIALQGTYPARS